MAKRKTTSGRAKKKAGSTSRARRRKTKTTKTPRKAATPKASPSGSTDTTSQRAFDRLGAWSSSRYSTR